MIIYFGDVYNLRLIKSCKLSSIMIPVIIGMIKLKSVSYFLFIGITTLDDGGFKFYQYGFIWKVLEDTGVEHCNKLPTITNFQAHLRKDYNGTEGKIYWSYSYAFIIGGILYLESKIYNLHWKTPSRGPLGFQISKRTSKKKYLSGENKLAANFHEMWLICLLLLSILRYPWIYISPLIVKVLRHILSLTMEKYLMNE